MSLERPYNSGYVWPLNSLSNFCRSVIGHPFSIIMATVLSASLLALLYRSLSLTAIAPMPGEERSGLFYALTHLPFFAYVILFIVLCLSVVNLLFQFGPARIWKWRIPFPVISEPKGTRVRWKSASHRSSHCKGAQTSTIHGTPVQAVDDGIVALRSLSKNDELDVFPPTPLDGTNHALPKFGPSEEVHVTKLSDGDVEHVKSITTTEFRFGSAVDRPSLEEVERREKERLVVTGVVKSTEGNPVGSAVVYLADPEGNKIGQSCRSNSENGAFKVIANESGAYFLHAYKRGYVISNLPNPIPVASGRVDDLEVTLVSEGCLIHGQAILESGAASAKNLLIKCVCRSDNFTGTSLIDDVGNFRFTNVPMNSECYLEAVNQDGTVLVRTEAFQTVQKKKLYKDIKITHSHSVVLDESAEVLNPFIESKVEDLRDEPTLVVSAS